MNSLPPVLLISMERSAERRVQSTQALKSLGLDYELVKAVDGSKLSDIEFAQAYNFKNTPFFSSPLTRGEVGCYLSHLKCYDIMHKRNMPWALIMEDDMIPDEKLLNVLEQWHRFPDDWEIIHLAPNIRNKPGAFKQDNLYHRTTLTKGCYISKYFPLTYHTHLYLIKQQCLERLEHHLQPIRVPIDHALFDLRFSMNFPYAVYQYEHKLSKPYVGKLTGSSEIDSMGPRRLRETVRGAISFRQKNLIVNNLLLRMSYIAFNAIALKIMCNLPWHDTNKRHYLTAQRYPSNLQLTSIVFSKCGWRFLPFVTARIIWRLLKKH